MREQQEEGEPSFDGGAVAEVKTYLEHKIFFFPALQMRISFFPSQIMPGRLEPQESRQGRL